jgi:hypothetical protein
MMHIFYLHGLASSPGSNKARYYREAFAAYQDVTVRVPDLNVPDFEHLTLTAMLARVAQEVRDCPPGDVVLMGSSMGGLTALHFADRFRAAEGARVKKLVLMAPAFDFMDNRSAQLGAWGMEEWRQKGYLSVFHFAYNEERRLHYGLVEDVRQYDSYAVSLDVPMLIYHGKNDASVPYQQSERYAQGRANVTLRLLDSDHQLLDQTETMLAGMVEFLGLKSVT